MKSNLSLVQVIELLKTRSISPYELSLYYWDRIKKLDPTLNSFISLDEEAVAGLKSIKGIPDTEKPLRGIPVAVKDIFVTDNRRTTAASKLLNSYIPQYSATVVRKLEEAGAVVIGKTNLDAWCHGSSTETSDYGAVRNPWNTQHLPGGSSGGSAASVAADLVPVSVGTETAGSVRGPAAWCGIVGLKPTYGRVSRYGVIAMGSSLDSPGPLTKSVEDAALMLEIMAGKDPFDATTSEKPIEKYTASLKKGIKKMKIGLAKDYLLPQMDKRVIDLIKDAVKVMRALGAEIEEVKTLDPRYAIGVYTIIQRSEVSSNLSRYDGIRYGEDRSYFAEEAKRRIMLGTYTLSSGYQDRYYKKAQKVRTLFIRDFENIFKKYDLIIGPTMPGPAPKLGVTKGQAMFGEMADVLTEPTSIAGLPGISVPCGFVDGLPIGLDIIGPQFSESRLLSAAYAYEQDTDWHAQYPSL